MQPAEVHEKTVVVMGLGLNRGGVGVSKWLMKHGAKLIITDLQSEAALADSIAEIERFFIVQNRTN